MSLDVRPLGHRPAPRAPGLRQVLAETRARIDRADRENDQSALSEEKNTLSNLACHYYQNGGGSVEDVVQLWAVATDRLRDVIARRAIANNPYQESGL